MKIFHRTKDTEKCYDREEYTEKKDGDRKREKKARDEIM